MSIESRTHDAVGWDEPGNKILLVDQLSSQDYCDAQTTCQELCSSANSSLEACRNEIEQGVEPEENTSRLKQLERNRDRKETLMSNLDSFRRCFGHVFATSGYKIADRSCSLDWGLVEVKKDRVRLNLVPDLSTAHILRFLMAPGDPVIEVDEMKLNDLVFVFGCESDVRMGQGRNLAEKGDSGAFVINFCGALVGMVVGGNPKVGSTYVTPIEEVFQDIKAQTGFTVTLPQHQEE
ncbi:MAG: hypothetical protein M1837_001574 [Sclerophora amabilis]|nr:MAG: hypothetical protein M1837_001574 [Sclerophora amabilis]